MKIQNDYYGEVEYAQEDLVSIPAGFLGFSSLTSYLPICLSEDEGSLLLMQSVEQSDIAFVMINPAFLCPDYSPVLAEEDLSLLDVSDSGELSYYVLCVIHDNYLENTVNMKCPLAINPCTRIGRQVILENSDYGYRHALSSFPNILDSVKSEDEGDKYADTASEKE